MRVEIRQFEDIADSLYIKVIGLWHSPEFVSITDQIISKRPTYLVADASEAILSMEQALPIEETNELRRNSIEQIVQLMQENPNMLYIIINPNKNPALMSGMPYYQELGIADRYIFVRDEAEALRQIEIHRFTSNQT